MDCLIISLGAAELYKGLTKGWGREIAAITHPSLGDDYDGRHEMFGFFFLWIRTGGASGAGSGECGLR